MYVHYDPLTNQKPIKIWLESAEQMEAECLQQAINLTTLPFLHKWVALMPDTHLGMGMPIGGVIALKNTVIPNSVGVDIGCGMAFIQTNIEVRKLKETMTGSGSLVQNIVGDILRNIPVGFGHHKEKKSCQAMDEAKQSAELYTSIPELYVEIEQGYTQVGTLGGGNHFIELQEDEQGALCIMLHSGSRNFGYKICNYFHTVARELNQKWHTCVPDEFRLAFLPTDTQEGKDYINWMQLALAFAAENRSTMLGNVMKILNQHMHKQFQLEPEYSNMINCHHNYAAIEHHYGENVWVHRKGAIRALEGDLGIIPGAMGSSSYIVRGKGNEESFQSCSHGAGRLMSRKKAMESFSIDKVMNDLKQEQVVLGKKNKEDVAEESRFAYKDIEQVMRNEMDLVKPIKKLKTVGVVKG